MYNKSATGNTMEYEDNFFSCTVEVENGPSPPLGYDHQLSFYAFDEAVPGSNRFMVLEKDEPYLQIKLARCVGTGWREKFVFYAFDVSAPETCLLRVHHRRDAETGEEQHRLHTKCASGSTWLPLMEFYAYDV
jgi:hypothetical protein